MDIKEYDKLTSAGEISFDLFCGLLPLSLRESQKTNSHTRKTPYVTALQSHARQRSRGGRTSHMKGVGMIVENFELNP